MDEATLQLGESLMEVAVQAGNLSLLREAVSSACQTIRFGSEFCMYALPTVEAIKDAYKSATDARKGFVYVTPRLADHAMDQVRQHLSVLNSLGDATVVANDLGTLRVLKRLPGLKPYLGRQLVYTPSRCPWGEITEQTVSIFAKRNVKRIFYQTALNYGPTIEFFKGLGAIGADVDWIPECFKNLNFLSGNELRVSVHLHAVPAAITRKCHMARFLGEENLERCSRPCYTRAYSMENEYLKTGLFLEGNAVFRLVEPVKKEMGQLKESGVAELVLTMNPLTGIKSQAQIDGLIRSLELT